MSGRRLGLAALAIVTLVVVAHYLVAPQDPLRTDLATRLQPPGAGHWLGTDELGRDVWALLAAGAVGSLTVALVAVTLSSAIGSAVGTVAGLAGGVVDRAATTAIDTLIAFPRFLIVLNLMAVFRVESTWTLGLLIGLTSWMRTARLVRTETLSLRGRVFVEAARSLGAGPLAVIGKHLTPQLLGLVLETARLRVASVILTAASLDFLGVGLAADAPAWGRSIRSGQAYLADAPWIALPAAAALCLTSVGLVLAGERRRRG